MQPRSAGVYVTSTRSPSTSQPLRLAYISIVIAVHEASEAASSSWGLGPSWAPPRSFGSSAVIVCEPILTSWRNPASRVADARMVPMLRSVSQRVEQQSGEYLREEVGRLGRHDLARGGDLADEVDRRRAHEQRGLHVACADALPRLVPRAGVVEAPEVRDVVLGHAEGALQQERLSHRGVEPPVGVGLA